MSKYAQIELENGGTVKVLLHVQDAPVQFPTSRSCLTRVFIMV